MIKDEFGVLSDRASFQQFIESFGAWAPLAIIAIIIAEAIIAPLPGFVPIVSAGFIFGTIEGSIYALVGNMIGSLMVFLIARKFGRYIALRFIDNERLDKYECAIERRENILLILYFFPIFPTDIISVAFGLSKIKLKKFILVTSIGFIFNVWALNYFGDYLAKLYF